MERKNTGTKRLKTKRLVLRKILPHDFIFAMVWYTRAELAQFTASKKPFTIRDTRRLTVTKFLHYNKNHFSWAIVRNGRMIGIIELMEMSNEGSYNIHYKLDFKYRGNGYAKEAVNAVLEYASTQRINTIYGHCDINNIPSYYVMKNSKMEQYTPKRNIKIKYSNGEESDAYFFRYKTEEN